MTDRDETYGQAARERDLLRASAGLASGSGVLMAGVPPGVACRKESVIREDALVVIGRDSYSPARPSRTHALLYGGSCRILASERPAACVERNRSWDATG